MKERWQEIAERITREVDSEKLIQLSQELNQALAEKDQKAKPLEDSPAA